MRPVDLNLARRPFINVRPVKRAAWLLWLVGGVLLVANSALYWRHFSGRSEQSSQLEDIDRRIEEERMTVTRLERELASIGLDWQNQQAVFLNSKIEERTFSWSGVFDRLAEVMPLEVQLRRVTPRIVEPAPRRRSVTRVRPIRVERVHLVIAGSARSGEAVLEFVDALFAHPNFDDPNLSSEARQSAKLTDFSLTVVYVAGRSSDAATGAEGVPEEASEARAGGGRREPAGGASTADFLASGRIG